VLSFIGDAAIGNLIDLTLRHGAYSRRTAASVADAKALLTSWKPHLLLVNIDAEDGQAIQLINENGREHHVAVIALTRRADLLGKLDSFERGADDYITFPFIPDDLIARTRAVLRRTHGDPGSVVPTLRIGDLQIDVSSPSEDTSSSSRPRSRRCSTSWRPTRERHSPESRSWTRCGAMTH